MRNIEWKLARLQTWLRPNQPLHLYAETFTATEVNCHRLYTPRCRVSMFPPSIPLLWTVLPRAVLQKSLPFFIYECAWVKLHEYEIQWAQLGFISIQFYCRNVRKLRHDSKAGSAWKKNWKHVMQLNIGGTESPTYKWTMHGNNNDGYKHLKEVGVRAHIRRQPTWAQWFSRELFRTLAGAIVKWLIGLPIQLDVISRPVLVPVWSILAS